ncbi:MAG: gfo/Idh/MocA family oxidoreductase [Candidatus Omnitrophota bacterium]|jgi:predicted dehydrogenase|nr:MAG: gfo/Idh/MocA family oxidoreductase [Candidatus Omnitrophota bacterium]
MKEKMKNVTRRDFVRQAAFTTTSFLIASPHVLGRENSTPPSDKLNIAAVGVGGRAEENLKKMATENYAAFCDVDDHRAAKSYERYEVQNKYKDYRVMLDKHNDIDAVLISTPDHTHAVVAMNAIQRGKHVYVEKPLAHSIHEVRALMKAAQETKVQTQLGNQGHSYDDIRKLCEWIWDDAIGEVKEVQAWYTRPYGDGKPRPTETPPVPETLEWDLWLGPAAYRPYHRSYAPGSWRSWFDFGTGVLGDWVCHILDPAFWALKLNAPTRITAQNGEGEYSPERFPLQSSIQYDFPAREGMPPVTVKWTYGKPMDIPQMKEIELDDWNTTAGAILIGEKGCIVHGSHGAGNPRILPQSRADEYRKPPETIPRVKGDHQQDWVRACKEGKPAGSNFNYGGPLTELALLGVIATVLDKETLEWDSLNVKFKNIEKANRLLRSPYREGWSL